MCWKCSEMATCAVEACGLLEDEVRGLRGRGAGCPGRCPSPGGRAAPAATARGSAARASRPRHSPLREPGRRRARSWARGARRGQRPVGRAPFCTASLPTPGAARLPGQFPPGSVRPGGLVASGPYVDAGTTAPRRPLPATPGLGAWGSPRGGTSSPAAQHPGEPRRNLLGHRPDTLWTLIWRLPSQLGFFFFFLVFLNFPLLIYKTHMGPDWSRE